MSRYFEFSPHHKRFMGMVGARKLDDVEPFVQVWNRFAERWNEVELDRAMPLALHDRQFAGADVFVCATHDGSERISHDDWNAFIYFRHRRRDSRFMAGLSHGRTSVAPSDIRSVEVHYRTPENRDDIFQWLEAERARFEGNNHYDSVLDLKQD